MTRIQHYEEEFSPENRKISHYAKHLLDSISEIEEFHRKMIAIQAISGIKPVGAEEAVFYHTLQQIREMIYKNLEYTLEDSKHLGDKHYEKHFKDGI